MRTSIDEPRAGTKVHVSAPPLDADAGEAPPGLKVRAGGENGVEAMLLGTRVR